MPAATPRSWVIRRMAVPKLTPQVRHQRQDLRLHRHVQRGGRLVGDQQRRPAQQRGGDHHPLAHAAGELVGIHPQPGFRLGDLHGLQQLHALPPGRGTLKVAMALQHQAHLGADRQVGIQRGHRVLEDHGDPGAADLAQPRRRQPQELVALEADAAGHPPVVRHQAQYGHRRLGLARAGFAHDPQHFAGRQRKGQVLHGVHRPVPGGEGHVEIADVEELACHRPLRSRGSSASRRPSPR